MLREQGIAGVTMRNIADAAGMTAPALYWHYADKDALLRDVRREIAALYRDLVYESVGDGPPLERLKGAVSAFRRFAVEEPQFYDALFVAPVPAGSPRRPSSMFQILVERVQDCMRHNDLVEEDAVDVALTISAHAQGLVQLYRRGRFETKEAFAEFFDRSMGRVMRGISKV